jgi:hypothetical protein
MRVHVDKSWCDQPASRIDRSHSLAAGEAANGDDTAVAHGEIRTDPRIAGAIEDTAASDEEVEGRVRRLGGIDRG